MGNQWLYFHVRSNYLIVYAHERRQKIFKVYAIFCNFQFCCPSQWWSAFFKSWAIWKCSVVQGSLLEVTWLVSFKILWYKICGNGMSPFSYELENVSLWFNKRFFVFFSCLISIYFFIFFASKASVPRYETLTVLSFACTCRDCLVWQSGHYCWSSRYIAVTDCHPDTFCSSGISWSIGLKKTVGIFAYRRQTHNPYRKGENTIY